MSDSTKTTFKDVLSIYGVVMTQFGLMGAFSSYGFLPGIGTGFLVASVMLIIAAGFPTGSHWTS